MSAVDDLLFGPAVEFAATTRYSLDDSIARLASVTMPRFQLTPRFHQGLFGEVNADRVAVAWHNIWLHDQLQPWFVGRFIGAGHGVELRGTIGMQPLARILSYAAVLIWAFVFLPVWYFQIVRPHAMQHPLLATIAISLLALGSILAQARFRRGDIQRIADALDAALT